MIGLINDQYGHWQLIPDMTKFYDDKKAKILYRKIDNAIHRGSRSYTLEQLEKVCEILNIDTKENNDI